MEQRVDTFLNKLEQAFSKWLTGFESHPIRSGVKVLIAIWVLRFVKRQVFS